MIKKASNVELYFTLKAGNGETILTSERYAAKDSAKNGIESVKKNAPNDDRYDRKAAKNGQFMFNLTAANHQVIGTSETYASAAGRDKGIESVKANAPGVGTDDQA